MADGKICCLFCKVLQSRVGILDGHKVCLVFGCSRKGRFCLSHSRPVGRSNFFIVYAATTMRLCGRTFNNVVAVVGHPVYKKKAEKKK